MYKGRDPLREEPNIERRKTGKVFFFKKKISLNIQQPEHPKMKRKPTEKEIY